MQRFSLHPKESEKGFQGWSIIANWFWYWDLFSYYSPLLLKEEWPQHNDNLSIANDCCGRGGWFFDFKIFLNASSDVEALFLRNDVKDLRPFKLERFLFSIDINGKKGTNQPPRPGNKPCNNHIINLPGHSSLKRANS